MKATVEFDMTKVISEAIAAQGYERNSLDKSLALLEALLYICEYEFYRHMECTGDYDYVIKHEANMLAVSALAKAADYFYLEIDRGSFMKYQILLADLMAAHPRLHDAVVEFNIKLDLGEIDTFEFSEIALATLDKLS